MAETILYKRSDSGEREFYSMSDNSDVDTDTSEELNVKLEELTLEESGRKGAKCESCVREECPGSDEDEGYERVRELYGRVAVFFCCLCKMFVCAECLPKHQWHEGKKLERKGAKCESCVREECPGSDEDEGYERVRELYGRVAVFFCFLCKMFVCAECLPKHQWHEGKEVEREEGEGMEEQRERERNKGKGLGKETKRMRLETESEKKKGNEGNESDRMIEKRERERKRREYTEKLFQSENDTEIREKFVSSHAVICDRIEVKHELDQNEGRCEITGLCGLENKRLVVCDFHNVCIKIFKLGSHVLQRYIRFVGSGSNPGDVTEIDLKRNSTDPNSESGSSSDISVTDRADPNKQCLIAVTLPLKRQIMFIDLSKNPAEAHKIIKTEKYCDSIQFYDDKIFALGGDGSDLQHCSVYIYSTDGDVLNKFDIGIYGCTPHLAVVSGRVYITDRDNDKVECRNVEGQLISEIEIEGSEPAGISVDPDNNVYLCAWEHNEVYKLDADLTRYKSVLDQTTDYTEEPRALCYYRDKLFISHGCWSPSLGDFITVVLLL